MSAADTICEGCGLLTGSTNAWLQHTRQCVMRLRFDEADRAARLARPVEEHEALTNEASSPSAWQDHVAAYPREEFLAMFRQAHATLHRLWTEAVGKDGYDKSAWKLLDNALARFARDAAEKSGIGRTEPLL